MPIAAVVGTVVGGIFGASASKSAANAQSNAALQAAQLQHQDAQSALQFQQQVYGNTQQQMAPWLSTGSNAINQLNQLMGLGQPGQSQISPAAAASGGFQNPDAGNFGAGGFGRGANFGTGGRLSMLDGGDPMNPMRNLQGIDMGIPAQGTGGQAPGQPGGPVAMNGNPAMATATQPGGANSYLQPFSNWNQTFQAPTNVTEQNDPGYKFRLQQGQQALENSAAARGGLLSGGTMKAEQQFGQDYASNEYGNVYNRALGEYQQNYNIFQNQQNTQFNRLASLSGFGQTAAAQLGSAGQSAAGNVGNIFLTSGQQQGNALQNAAAARASGYVGSANAYGNMFTNLSQLGMLFNSMNQQSQD